MLKVLIADDHEIVRRGVRHVVESRPDWEVCGEAATGQAALEAAAAHQPHVTVLDVSLPGLGGIAVARRLKQSVPATEILLFSVHDDNETIAEGLAAGARGYVLKSDGDEELVAAISALGAHRAYFSPSVSGLLLEATHHEGKKSQLGSFTARELEVGQLIAEGETTKSIARMLDISLKTVESHRASAMRKAGVRTAAEFVRFAIKNNLLRL